MPNNSTATDGGKDEGLTKALRHGARAGVASAIAFTILAMAECGAKTDLPPVHYRGSRSVSGWLTYWLDKNGAGIGWKTVTANTQGLDEVSFFSWGVNPATGDLTLPESGMRPSVIVDQVGWLHTRDVAALFTVTLFVHVHDTLNNPIVLDRLADQIVKTARMNGFDGVDIDFEEFGGNDPDDPGRYTAFLNSLAVRMHGEMDAYGFPKTVIATVLARTKRGKFNFTDEAAIANSAVDRVRVMAYDQFWPGSKTAGASAPLPWTKNVVRYIESVNGPQSKFVLGIPGYGYRWPVISPTDWTTTAKGLSVTFPQSDSLLHDHDAWIDWDESNQTPVMTFRDGDQPWVAFYEDAYSWRLKVDEAVLPSRLGGISEWALGYEDPVAWQMLAERFAAAYPIYGPIGQCYARYGGGAYFGDPLGPQHPAGPADRGAFNGREGIAQAFQHGTIFYKWGDPRAHFVMSTAIPDAVLGTAVDGGKWPQSDILAKHVN